MAPSIGFALENISLRNCSCLDRGEHDPNFPMAGLRLNPINDKKSDVCSDIELLLETTNTAANSLCDDLEIPFLSISKSDFKEFCPQTVHHS